jgi:hypothetical protein
MFRTYRYDNKVQETLDILAKNTYPKTMEALNKVTADHGAKLWFRIEETSPNQMRKHTIYLSIVMKDDETIDVYVGSATA